MHQKETYEYMLDTILSLRDKLEYHILDLNPTNGFKCTAFSSVTAFEFASNEFHNIFNDIENIHHIFNQIDGKLHDISEDVSFIWYNIEIYKKYGLSLKQIRHNNQSILIKTAKIFIPITYKIELYLKLKLISIECNYKR